ncbi:MAG: putative Ig domain-containing protein [Synergistaceae bacterium]|nr:putative Ig domain-containing protein [Synergistaceae bacterium]
MRKIVCVIAFLCLMVTGASASVEINSTNFPDALFRYYISVDCDVNPHDGWLSDEEIAAVKEFNKPGFMGNEGTIKMKSMKGVEYLTALVSIDCHDNPLLTELDVSRNKKLRYLNCKDCDTLASLNVSGLAELAYLHCATNSLTELDLTGCANLEELYCSVNSLDRLDLRGNMKLKKLECFANNLRTLDVSNHVYLTDVDSNMNYLESLSASGCTSLSRIYSPNNLLTSINVAYCPNLRTVNLNGNRFSELNLSGNYELLELDCGVNLIVSLDVSRCGKMTSLDCSDNKIRSLSLEGCAGLKSVRCANNQLDEIDISPLMNLSELDCAGNRLSELDVSGNYSLVSLRCANNYIKSINLSSNRNLRDLELQRNNITELDLSSNFYLLSGHILADQVTRVAKIERQSGSEYPYRLDFSGYVSAGNIGNIVASSVQAFGEDGSEIETVYSGGIAQFKEMPVMVRYSYNTGLGGATMDVSIEMSEFMSLSLNGHVYRAFNDAVSWENARKYCLELGGDLAMIKTDEQKEVARELIKKVRFSGGNALGGYWLGGTMDDDNAWKWIDGENFTGVLPVYTVARSIDIKIGDRVVRNVRRDFPEGLYLQMTESGDIVGWQDRHPGGFICEWEPVSVDVAPYSEEYLRWLSADHSGEAFYGYIPSPVAYSGRDLPKASYAYTPRSYDPRKEGEGRRILHVGDQKGYGTCWSFASLGALEASYVAQGYGSEAPKLSQLHQAWYLYRDPRIGYSEPIYPYRAVLDQGGDTDDSIVFLSRMGTASATDAPYLVEDNPYPHPYSYDLSVLRKSDAVVQNWVNSKLLDIKPEDYPHPIGFKAVYKLGKITEDNRERIKHLIMEYGAVKIAYQSTLEGFWYYSDGTKNYYMPDAVNHDHAIIAVGWNDDYPSSNFVSYSNPDGADINGAWLTINSWGTENFGDGGYCWISYAQDTSDCSVFVADNRKSSQPYAHDTTAAIDGIPHKWSANIFRAERTELLNAVSFHTRSVSTDYEVYVSKFGQTKPANPGLPQSTPVASGTLEYAGYHTIELNRPIGVEPGDYFAVMVKLSPKAGMEYGYYNTAVAKNNSFMDNVPATLASMSWFAEDDTLSRASSWIDGGSLEFWALLGYDYEDNPVFQWHKSANAPIKIFSIEANPIPSATAPTITTTSLASGTVGSQYSQTLTASGSTPITWTVTGLPGGLTHSNGTISGTPTQAGSFSVTATARNSAGSNSKTFTLVVSNRPIAPTITTTSLDRGTVGTQYSQQLTFSGTRPINLTVSGLPDGITISNGKLSGVPTQAGTYNVVVTARNSAGSDRKTFTIVINNRPTAPTITTTSLNNGTVGSQYSQTLTASGTTPITWTVTGLPGGLTHSNGTISGTPTQAGSFSVTATARNSAGHDSKTFTLVINNRPTAPTITTTSLNSGTVGSQYSQTLTAALLP